MKVLRPIEPAELSELIRQYGDPQRIALPLEFLPIVPSKRAGRRGEVVFAIRNRRGEIFLHTKRFYPDGVFRLPGGGIRWNERVEEALLREIAEETGLAVTVKKFVALVEYEVQGRRGGFATYLFLLDTDEETPQAQDGEEQITAFRAVTTAALREAGRQLRQLPAEWRVWGEFRAITHDLIADAVSAPK